MGTPALGCHPNGQHRNGYTSLGLPPNSLGAEGTPISSGFPNNQGCRRHTSLSTNPRGPLETATRLAQLYEFWNPIHILTQLQVQGCYPRSQALWDHWGRDRDPSPLTVTPHQKGSNASNQMTQTATLNLESYYDSTTEDSMAEDVQKFISVAFKRCLTGRGKNLQENF